MDKELTLALSCERSDQKNRAEFAWEAGGRGNTAATIRRPEIREPRTNKLPMGPVARKRACMKQVRPVVSLLVVWGTAATACTRPLFRSVDAVFGDRLILYPFDDLVRRKRVLRRERDRNRSADDEWLSSS